MEHRGAYSQDHYNACEWHTKNGVLSLVAPAESSSVSRNMVKLSQ